MVVVLDPADSADVLIRWNDIGAATITAVSYTPIIGLTLTPVAINGDTTSVRVAGVVHGRTYQIEAQATLSTGETLNRNVAVRGYNG